MRIQPSDVFFIKPLSCSRRLKVDIELSQKTRQSVSCQSTFAHSTETFLDSSAPSYNFYPKVSIFDLQSNRRAVEFESTLNSIYDILNGTSCAFKIAKDCIGSFIPLLQYKDRFSLLVQSSSFSLSFIFAIIFSTIST